jgi:hypothetical protein
MTVSARRTAAAAVLLVVTLSSADVSFAGEEHQEYRGRPLVEVLQSLQQRGLRIVFTSVTVTPALIVRDQPRATSPRAQLDELLAPHGLEAREGPGRIIQIVRARTRSRSSSGDEGASIEGRVLDAFTAAPIANAVVRVDGGRTQTSTDAAGRFIVRRVRTGTHPVHASASEYGSATHHVEVLDGTKALVVLRLVPAVSRHEEYVAVSGPWPRRSERGVPAESSLQRDQLQGLYGTLGDDPLRAVTMLPRVTAVDDYRSEFSVRGSPFRHVELVIDGISTPWLRHSAMGRGASGSLAMFATQVVDAATLRTGAYARRYGDRLGPQLDMSLREGSRSRTRFRAGLGGTTAIVLGEGPLTGSERGSWLFAGRQSLLEWPSESHQSTRTPFGFSDAVAKVAYDVRENQQIGMTVIAGTSSVDEEDNLAPNDLAGGVHRASAVSLSWRSRTRSGLTLTQRGYVVTQRFRNEYQRGDVSDRGSSEEIVYRAVLSRPLAIGAIEAGGQIGQERLEDVPRAAVDASGAPVEYDPAVTRGTATTRSAYAHFTWAPLRSLTVSPGFRVTGSSLLPSHMTSRWLLGEWAFRERWTLSASAGVSHQTPELRYALRRGSTIGFRPERSTHVDVALEQRLARSIRWQVTLFDRRETDVFRGPDATVRLVDGILTRPDSAYVNALAGTSRGVELELERHSTTGLSGWLAYSYGTTRNTDVLRGEAFPSDFDQRHTLNLFGTYRVGAAGLGATYRLGSNFPVAGYFSSQEGRFFVGSARNRVRLPAFARLDLRADYGGTYLGRRVTVFVEIWNATNGANFGLASASVDPATGEALGVTEILSRRRLFAGAVVDLD